MKLFRSWVLAYYELTPTTNFFLKKIDKLNVCWIEKDNNKKSQRNPRLRKLAINLIGKIQKLINSDNSTLHINYLQKQAGNGLADPSKLLSYNSALTWKLDSPNINIWLILTIRQNLHTPFSNSLSTHQDEILPWF